MENCPICGGIAENGVCVSCGFEMPDEKASAANEPSDQAEMDAIYIPSADDVSKELAPKPPAERKEVKYQPNPPKEQENAPLPSNYTHISRPEEETYEEPPKALEIFVHGFAEEVRKHWWKALLIAIVPASAIFIGFYYIAKGGGGRRRFVSVDPEKVNFKYIFTGILFLAIGTGMTFSGWDPIGLNERLLDLMRDGRR